MNDLTELQQIWAQADVSKLPAFDRMSKLIGRFYFVNILKQALVLVFAFFLLAVIIYVIVFSDSQLWTTRVGEASFLFALLILITNAARSIRKNLAHKNWTNNQFVSAFKEAQGKEIKTATLSQNIGFSISSLGLLFYMYELAYARPEWGIGVYGATLVFILINWFWVRPRANEKKAKRIGAIITKLQHLEKQLNEEKDI